VGVVIGGYATASFVVGAAVYVRLLHTQDAQAVASAGMYAFGDLLLFVFVFGAVALFPTGLALYFLRPVGRFWTVFSIGALAFAGTGLCAALVIALASAQPSDSFWGGLSGHQDSADVTSPPAGHWVRALHVYCAQPALAADVACRNVDRGCGGRVCLGPWGPFPIPKHPFSCMRAILNLITDVGIPFRGKSRLIPRGRGLITPRRNSIS
jgi:hypothetical protein